jgi:hypothetical protein
MDVHLVPSDDALIHPTIWIGHLGDIDCDFQLNGLRLRHTSYSESHQGE